MSFFVHFQMQPKLFRLFLRITFLILSFGVGMANGANRTASVSGNWNATATWGGQAAPTAIDDVTISDGMVLRLK